MNFTNNNKVFIIAEIGINHNGDLEKAKYLIKEAKLAGANAVKFQTFNTDLLIRKDQVKMPYQESRSQESNQYDMLKKVELNQVQHEELIAYSRSQEIEFISTPYDIYSAQMLVELGVRYLKIASTDTTNLLMLRKVKALKTPIILSTGVTSLAELEVVMKELSDYRNNTVLLHCVSNYPAPLEELNLSCIRDFQDRFDCLVGFSDHAESLESGAWATFAGARVLEKHFTYDKYADGPDHAASVTPKELKLYIQSVRKAELVYGDGEKRVMPSEKEIKKHMQKSLVVKRSMEIEEELTEDCLWAMRPATGISPLDLDWVLGKRLNVAKNAWEPIMHKDLG